MAAQKAWKVSFLYETDLPLVMLSMIALSSS